MHTHNCKISIWRVSDVCVTVIRSDRTRPWQGRQETPTSCSAHFITFRWLISIFRLPLIDAEECFYGAITLPVEKVNVTDMRLGSDKFVNW